MNNIEQSWIDLCGLLFTRTIFNRIEGCWIDLNSLQFKNQSYWLHFKKILAKYFLQPIFSSMIEDGQGKFFLSYKTQKMSIFNYKFIDCTDEYFKWTFYIRLYYFSNYVINILFSYFRIRLKASTMQLKKDHCRICKVFWIGKNTH